MRLSSRAVLLSFIVGPPFSFETSRKVFENAPSPRPRGRLPGRGAAQAAPGTGHRALSERVHSSFSFMSHRQHPVLIGGDMCGGCLGQRLADRHRLTLVAVGPGSARYSFTAKSRPYTNTFPSRLRLEREGAEKALQIDLHRLPWLRRRPRMPELRTRLPARHAAARRPAPARGPGCGEAEAAPRDAAMRHRRCCNCSCAGCCRPRPRCPLPPRRHRCRPSRPSRPHECPRRSSSGCHRGRGCSASAAHHANRR